WKVLAVSWRAECAILSVGSTGRYWGSETARVHHAARQCCCVAARCARAAVRRNVAHRRAGCCGRAMLISGRCHCGNISFALDWRPEPSEFPARACTCSFCAKHGGVWTSCPTGSLTVSVKDRVRVSKYEFGTKTAEFHVCTACGVVPVVTSRIDGRLFAVVSVNVFENVEPALPRRAPATCEGENKQARLSRRKRNWIADVQFDAAS